MNVSKLNTWNLCSILLDKPEQKQKDLADEKPLIFTFEEFFLPQKQSWSFSLLLLITRVSQFNV